MCSADGDALTAWASANDHSLLYDPNEPASFHSQRWNADANPELAFAHTGRSTLQNGKCHVTANSIATQLVQNGRFPNLDRELTRQVSKEYSNLWRAQCVDTDLARDFSYEELTIALKHLRHGKAPGPDNIHAEFLIHAGDHAN